MGCDNSKPVDNKGEADTKGTGKSNPSTPEWTYPGDTYDSAWWATAKGNADDTEGGLFAAEIGKVEHKLHTKEGLIWFGKNVSASDFDGLKPKVQDEILRVLTTDQARTSFAYLKENHSTEFKLGLFLHNVEAEKDDWIGEIQDLMKLAVPGDTADDKGDNVVRYFEFVSKLSTSAMTDDAKVDLFKSVLESKENCSTIAELAKYKYWDESTSQFTENEVDGEADKLCEALFPTDPASSENEDPITVFKRYVAAFTKTDESNDANTPTPTLQFSWENSTYDDAWWKQNKTTMKDFDIDSSITSKAGMKWFGTDESVTPLTIQNLLTDRTKDALFDTVISGKESLEYLLEHHSSEMKFGFLLLNMEDDTEKGQWIDAIQEMLSVWKDMSTRDAGKNSYAYFNWVMGLDLNKTEDESKATKLDLFQDVLDGNCKGGKGGNLTLASFKYEVDDESPWWDMHSKAEEICDALFPSNGGDRVGTNDELYEKFEEFITLGAN